MLHSVHCHGVEHLWKVEECDVAHAFLILFHSHGCMLQASLPSLPFLVVFVDMSNFMYTRSTLLCTEKKVLQCIMFLGQHMCRC